VFLGSGSSVFVEQIQMIDPSRLFLIVRLTYSTVAILFIVL
jgi:hypothetical protein